MQRKIYLVDQFWWEQNRSVMECHILHYGVISDIEEYFLLFFFLSNTTSSWFCIKSLKFKINHNHKFTTSSASRSNSRSCRQRSSFIFLLAHSSSSWVRLSFNCLSTPTGKQSLLSTTLNDFFHVFSPILLPLQIGSSDNIHLLFTCFSPWSLIITFLLSLILLIIHVYDEPTQPMLWESSFVEMIPNMFS